MDTFHSGWKKKILEIHMKWNWMVFYEKGEMHVDYNLSFYAFGGMMLIGMIDRNGLFEKWIPLDYYYNATIGFPLYSYLCWC